MCKFQIFGNDKNESKLDSLRNENELQARERLLSSAHNFLSSLFFSKVFKAEIYKAVILPAGLQC
jgi:hypothetical protein